MSTAASRYAEYGSACPRCQQIINTMDITFQQGIFIYDLTFIQQELESVLIGAVQRQSELLEQNENENYEDLKLPLSSMVRLPNGKKPRDFKAERERRRKAFNGHMSRKRRMKKTSTRNFFQTTKREKNSNGFESSKKNSLSRNNSSESSSRPIRSYRPINFTYPYSYETNHRNGTNHHSNKYQNNHLSYPEQFWTKILTNQNEYLKSTDYNFLDKLIHINQLLLDNFDYEKEYQQNKQLINSNEYLLTNDKYIHPELEYSIVLKHNTHLYNFVDNITNNNHQQKNPSTSNNHRLKRKFSNISSNHQDSISIDDNLLEYFQRDNNTTFSSKYAELQHRLAESINLERIALNRAENQYKSDNIQIELNEIDDKILEITNSIRQRKRPSENAVSLCKPTSPLNNNNNNNNNHHQNGNNESEAWRKGRRQSTLRVYDELARLMDERMNLEKQIADINPFI